MKLYQEIKNQFNITIYEFVEKWKQFLNNCESLFSEDKTKATWQLKILNSFHPAINFTIEVSENTLLFLDIMIRKDGNKIWMDVYSKPTDSKRYAFL